jgi:hypothetical protein
MLVRKQKIPFILAVKEHGLRPKMKNSTNMLSYNLKNKILYIIASLELNAYMARVRQKYFFFPSEGSIFVF